MERMKKKETIPLNLKESLVADLKVRIQPSLLAVFRDRCENWPTGPLDVSDQIRRLMAEWVVKTRDGQLL